MTNSSENTNSGDDKKGHNEEGDNNNRRRRNDEDYSGDGERQKLGAMEVAVDHSIERAIKVLKRKLIKEGLFKELKARKYFEKPSERRKRKEKEAVKKVRKDEARSKKNSMLI